MAATSQSAVKTSATAAKTQSAAKSYAMASTSQNIMQSQAFTTSNTGTRMEKPIKFKPLPPIREKFNSVRFEDEILKYPEQIIMEIQK